MGLADDLSKPTGNPWAKKCAIARLCDELSDVDKEALVAALNNPEINAAFIHRKIIENGYQIGSDSIRRHRRGDCCKDLRNES